MIEEFWEYEMFFSIFKDADAIKVLVKLRTVKKNKCLTKDDFVNIELIISFAWIGLLF